MSEGEIFKSISRRRAGMTSVHRRRNGERCAGDIALVEDDVNDSISCRSGTRRIRSTSPTRKPRVGFFAVVATLLLVASTNSAGSFASAFSTPRWSSSSSSFTPTKKTSARSTGTTVATSSSSPSSTTTSLFMWNRDDDDILSGSNKYKACVPYILPLLDGDVFGAYMYQRIPPLGAVHEATIGPVAELYRSVPLLGLGLFVAFTLGTRFNTDIPRNVRFSAQQAALLDVALLIPELIGSSMQEADIPRYVAEPCSNFVFYAYITAVAYCLYCNAVRGRKPNQIPFISDYSEMMVGPF